MRPEHSTRGEMKQGRLRWLLPVLATTLVAAGAGWVAVGARGQIAVQNQGYVPFSDAPIHYRSENLGDPVARLQQRMNRGEAMLNYDPDHGYLRSVLASLKVPIDSQTLVFSKTSFQYTKISPEHPRALYFNDDVYVGSVHDGKAIEIVSFDPMQGAIFYLLDEHKAEKPVFQRAELDCTQCHIAPGTRGVPGVLLRSVYPTSTGDLAIGRKTFITDQNSPLQERWGGWYVTGNLSGFATLANRALPKDAQNPHAGGGVEADPATGGTAAQLVDISKSFAPSAYLIADSDVVAHLVLAHQTQMHNLITLTNYRTRIALYAQASQGNTAGEPATTLSDSLEQQFQVPAEQLLRYMLFVNEAPLNAQGNLKSIGSSGFAKQFAARGPRDSKGRSLRDFDLKTRIFRYPCSYLVYTESFDAIPDPAKGYIYHRLLEILTGQDQSPDFARLTEQDRKAILEILLETKPGLPDEWRSYAKSHHMRLAEKSSGSGRPRQG